ncbi:glycosyltransferase family 4 protein [Patescibacteria group bacterium]|nr:glycosyltransferase family 4 protein [Patescibacteria group bacterium]
MKIAQVCPYRFNVPGGVREHVRCLTAELRQRGHKVTIISPGHGLRRVGSQHLYLGRAVKVPTTNKSWAHVSIYLDSSREPLSQLLRSYDFDIIHFHAPLSPFLCWQILQVSKVINVATFHSEWRITESLVADSLDFLLRPLLPKFKEKLNGVIAVSQAARRSWDDFFGQSLHEKIIPNGVDLKRFSSNVAPLKVFGEKPTVLFVGRVEKRKGLPYLLKAFKKLQKNLDDVRLVVVGSGPLLPQAKVWVKAQGLARKVFFAGRVSDEELPAYYTGADVYCSPAIGGESFGIVLLEAMASGTPLTVFNNPGYQEVLQDCPAESVLVPCEDTAALCKSLEEILKDKQLREEIRQWGLAEVQKYTWPKIAGQVEKFYEGVLNGSV